jgi:hypothetical protein
MKRAGAAILICRRGRAERTQCRRPGCGRYATQANWGCRSHWFELPPDLRARIWQAAVRDRGPDGQLGKAWQAAADEAERWIAEQGAKPPAPDRRQPELPF